MKKKATFAYVRWFDSSIYKGDPCQVNELMGRCENESAGLLLKETKGTITLALDRCLDTKDVRMVLCIPRENILSFKKFRVHRKR